jgi:uncharacterized protein (DUF58 family)
VERTREVYAIIDASRLSGRSLGGATHLDRFVSAALILDRAAEQQDDLFGLAAFSDRVHRFLRAGRGSAHYGACRDALYRLEPNPVAPDFDELFSTLRLRLRRRSLLVFLTELDDPVAAEKFARNVGLLARQHLVMVNMIRPSGVRPLFSGEAVNSPGDVINELAGHLRWQKLRELERSLAILGVHFSLLNASGLSRELAAQYARLKQMQAL